MDLLYQIFIDPFVQMVQVPDLLVQTLWEGLVSGVLYALIALGFVLIFKASGVFNFAQGIMVVFAALTLVWLHGKGVPAFVALAVTIGVMFVLAFDRLSATTTMMTTPTAREPKAKNIAPSTLAIIEPVTPGPMAIVPQTPWTATWYAPAAGTEIVANAFPTDPSGASYRTSPK